MATLTITDATGAVFECEVGEPVITQLDRLDWTDALTCARSATVFTFASCSIRTFRAGSGDGRGGNARDRRRQRRAGTLWRSLGQVMDDDVDALEHGGRIWMESSS